MPKPGLSASVSVVSFGPNLTLHRGVVLSIWGRSVACASVCKGLYMLLYSRLDGACFTSPMRKGLGALVSSIYNQENCPYMRS